MTAHQPPGPPDYYLLRHLRSAARDPMGFYTRSWKQYGDSVRFHWYGPFAMYLFVHPDAAERVLQANWSNYPKGFFYKRLGVFTGKGLFTSEGDLWLRQRRLAQPAFHRRRISTLTRSMGHTVAEMLDEWDRAGQEEVVDVAAEMMRLTLRIAGRALFGTELTRETADWLHHHITAGVLHVEHRFNPLTLPESVPTPRNRRFLAQRKKLGEWILNLAEERRRAGSMHDDLLQMLVDARDEETGQGMSDEQLVDEVITLLIAGHETTADSLAWALSLLARYPGHREELEAESARALSGRVPEFEDLPSLPYALQVFQEATRLYPPIWTLSREAREDDEILGYRVPARSTVLVPPFLTHRHPEFWPDPDTFDPARFEPHQAANRHRYAFYPFGGGPRLCIGQQFGLIEGQIALAAISSRYRLDLAPGEKLEVHPTLALRPRNGLHMIRHRLL